METFASCACAALTTYGTVPAVSGTLTSAASATLDSNFLKAISFSSLGMGPSGSQRHVPAMVPAGSEMPRSRNMSQIPAHPGSHCSMLGRCKSQEDRVAFKLYIGNKCVSSWSLRPWLAMKQLEIPFEEEVIRLRTPETAANLAKVSPNELVPVLHHDGKVIWDSLAIL